MVEPSAGMKGSGLGRILRNVGALLFGVSILLLGAGLFQTFLSLRMAFEHFGALTIGAMPAAWCAGSDISGPSRSSRPCCHPRCCSRR
jgi:hypothetical protein